MCNTLTVVETYTSCSIEKCNLNLSNFISPEFVFILWFCEKTLEICDAGATGGATMGNARISMAGVIGNILVSKILLILQMAS